MSHLPDFTVMNRDQTTKQLVEVKYRSNWSKNVFEEVKDQVKLFGENCTYFCERQGRRSQRLQHAI